MFGTKTRILLIIFFISVFVLGMYASAKINTDFGNLEVTKVKFASNDLSLEALLYRPVEACELNPVPGVVVAHGICESKDMMSSLGLELARGGFAVLCLDLPGHGGSQGSLQTFSDKPDLGINHAVDYLAAQKFVNQDKICLVGHSLGAGAVRATAFLNNQITATVFIGGGFGDHVQNQEYGTLNSTFPKNLLLLMGKYDSLIDLTYLKETELPKVFNATSTVEIGVLYGTFASQTARKIVTPPTTHLFEPVDPTVISETVTWIKNATHPSQLDSQNKYNSLIYGFKELALICSLIGLFTAIILIYSPLSRLLGLNHQQKENPPQTINLKTYTVWSALTAVLFFPMVAVGFVINFPPLILGSSLAWWLSASGLFGLLILKKTKTKLNSQKICIKYQIKKDFKKNYVLIAISLFILFFVNLNIAQATFNVNLKLLVALFQNLTSLPRIFAFFAFIPFFYVYFAAQNLHLHLIEKTNLKKQQIIPQISYCLKIILFTITPFLIILSIQFFPKIIFDIWLLPHIMGFLIEVLWLIIPLLVIALVFSLWFELKTKNIATGVIFNTLMLAWIAATVFPF